MSAATGEKIPERLAVLVSFSGQGGVERIMIKLVNGFADHGILVDLLAIIRSSTNCHFENTIDSRVNVIKLKAKHTNLALPELVRYLRSVRPAAILAAKDRAIRIAALSQKYADINTRLVGRLGTNLLTSLQGKSVINRWIRCAPMKWFYRHVDHVVAVSNGVAEDTLSITKMPRSKVSVIRNPVIDNHLKIDSKKPVNHPWFETSGPPVIVGAGRLTPQKDFPTLFHAFSHVRRTTDCRLIILGEGRLKNELQSLASDLGITDAVSFPGHVQNIYSYMANASVFVLSSAWEGSPNVLTEALALGRPVVSTDCPSGPREILVDGHFGPLVPVGDAKGMAAAILKTLASPPAPSFLKEAVKEYTAERSVRRYLDVLGYP